MMDYLYLGAGWFIYFAVHSVLASVGVKRFAERTLGKAFRYYRVAYSLIATAGLVLLMFMNERVHSEYFFEREGLPRFMSFVFTAFGVMTIQLAFRVYRLSQFLGFRTEEPVLKVEGILKYVRHPIYSGLILVTLGFFLFIPSLATAVSCACIFLYLPVGIWLEERKLIAQFGDSYVQYKLNVPAVIPRLKKNL